MTESRPSRRLLVSMIVIFTGLVWCGWLWRSSLRFRHAMAAVQNDIQAGRFATAGRSLKELLAASPHSDEAAYYLGLCEKAMGRADAARDAWAGVPPDSRFASRAIQGRMELEIERGRLAEAERIIEVAASDRRNDASGLRLYLGQILTQQGRVEETKQIIEARWVQLNTLGEGAAESAINLVRLYIDLRSTPTPVESIRDFLDQMGRMAPDDDRVWLGKANLAIRLGANDEAEKWLAACLRRRPDDSPVWRARLDWAMAANRVQEAIEALDHLPAREFEPARIDRLAAWLGAQRGEVEIERGALEKLVPSDPTDFAALDRLAALEAEDGRPERAQRLRQEKAEIDQLQGRYQKLFRRNQPIRDSEAMARLASRLGYTFEARAFLTVAVDVDGRNKELRRELAQLETQVGDTRAGHPTLASMLAAEIGRAESTGRPDPSPSVSGDHSTIPSAHLPRF